MGLEIFKHRTRSGAVGRWLLPPPRPVSRPPARMDVPAGTDGGRGGAGAPPPPGPCPPAPPGEPLEARDGAGGLARLAGACRRFVLHPRSYFVAWGGVLTLAFGGVPEQLGELKGALEEALPGLPKENFGSKWPKASLGCLRDGRTLTRDELGALDRLCTELSKEFGCQPPGPELPVDRLELVLFACRSLEKRLTTTTLWLGEDLAWPQRCDTSVTDEVLAERLADGYWDGVARAGNREAHYREAAWGATLVAPVGWGVGLESGDQNHSREEALGSAALELAVRTLRLKVDELLPGAYVWFSAESLHVTVRGLFG